MKKLFPVLWLILLVLTGCSAGESHRIDDSSWRMTSIQSMEADGQAIACAPGQNSGLNTAKEIILICTAKDGIITLIDETSGQSCSGSYRLVDSAPESSNYEVMIGETEGMAVVSTTTYHDDSSRPTLIIRIGDYVLNFFAENN